MARLGKGYADEMRRVYAATRAVERGGSAPDASSLDIAALFAEALMNLRWTGERGRSEPFASPPHPPEGKIHRVDPEFAS
jgi:hypothetical protein